MKVVKTVIHEYCVCSTLEKGNGFVITTGSLFRKWDETDVSFGPQEFIPSQVTDDRLIHVLGKPFLYVTEPYATAQVVDYFLPSPKPLVRPGVVTGAVLTGKMCRLTFEGGKNVSFGGVNSKIKVLSLSIFSEFKDLINCYIDSVEIGAYYGTSRFLAPHQMMTIKGPGFSVMIQRFIPPPPLSAGKVDMHIGTFA